MNKFRLKILVLILCFCLSGCGVIDYFFLKPPEDTAQELAEAGYEALQQKNYDAAIEYFSKLKDRYPFSPYTPKAEVSLGDAYFLNGDYKAAVEVYKEFESLHPRHEAIPYVLFKIGLADFKQFETVDKPYTSVKEALSYFRRLIETYPQSKYSILAKKYLRKCRLLMAEHELFVADFYFKTERYLAAWKRYSYVEKNYSDLPEVLDYVKVRKDLAYLKYQEQRGEKIREKEQGSWKEWFDWL
ncbi:MAG: outer membrane protein assembly factor BamD [Desulfonauticus sp.]|nr:outer membrane protein assembly factor BamD [Desulfonauticus sp.]